MQPRATDLATAGVARFGIALVAFPAVAVAVVVTVPGRTVAGVGAGPFGTRVRAFGAGPFGTRVRAFRAGVARPASGVGIAGSTRAAGAADRSRAAASGGGLRDGAGRRRQVGGRAGCGRHGGGDRRRRRIGEVEREAGAVVGGVAQQQVVIGAGTDPREQSAVERQALFQRAERHAARLGILRLGGSRDKGRGEGKGGHEREVFPASGHGDDPWK